MHTAFIGLGSNLGAPEMQLRRAMAALAELPHTRLLAASSLYRSAPVGNVDQPDFVNAVVQVATALAPQPLLAALQETEKRFGRERSVRNAARTLDLDLLLYNAQIITVPGLELPHPRMHQRAFVLAPLVEIAPDCEVPGKGRAAALLANCAGQDVERLARA